MIKVILTSKPKFEGYSIEGGFHDGIKHFDHHGKFSNEVSPCNNFAIRPITEKEAVIEITHIDADTLLGIARLFGKDLPKINLDLLEKIDLNGSSVCNDKFNKTLLYSIGVNTYARELNFPRVTDEKQDVTELINIILNSGIDEIVDKGNLSQLNSEKAYKDCCIEKNNNKILFKVDKNQPLNPSRAYEDAFDVVVVYRENWKTISIYCNPNSSYSFGGKTILGIEFGGHPKACGSPRGKEMTWKQAIDVFNAINL